MVRQTPLPLAIRALPWLHKIFRGDSQSIGHAIDVIKIGGYLGDIVNFFIAVAAATQRLHVILSHLAGGEGQFFGKGQGSLGVFRQPGGAPIFGKSLYQGVVVSLFTEVMQVGLRSVRAVIGLRDHHGYHLSLRPAQHWA